MERHSAINFKKLCDICRIESRLFDCLTFCILINYLLTSGKNVNIVKVEQLV